LPSFSRRLNDYVYILGIEFRVNYGEAFEPLIIAGHNNEYSRLGPGIE